MSQRQACPYCGNRAFEEENGILVCTSCGRQQEGGLQVAEEEPEYGTFGKVSRKKVERTKVKSTKIYRGPRGSRLYLQAWQHILWRQAHALIHGPLKAQPELWGIVRDLWTLWLSKLAHRLSGSEDLVPEVNQNHSNSADDLSSDQAKEAHHTKKNISLQPKLWDTVSLVYLGTYLLRLPIPIATFYHLIRTEELTFIRAVRSVPHDISSKLPSEYREALDTTTIPTTQELQESIYKLLQDYTCTFGMLLPMLNYSTIALAWIDRLALPLEIYPAVNHLASLIEYDFTYHFAALAGSDGHESRRRRRSPVANPEVQLISLILVAVKLLYPWELDKTSHTPDTPSTLRSLDGQSLPTSIPARLLVDWRSWLEVHKSYSRSSRSQPSLAHKEIELSASLAQHLSLEDMDSYMDWYQHTYTTSEVALKEKKTELEMNILNTFPLPDDGVACPPNPAANQVEDTSSSQSMVQQIQMLALRQARQNESPSIQLAGEEPLSNDDGINTANKHRTSYNPTQNLSYQLPYLVFSKPEHLTSTDIFFDASNEHGIKTSKNNPLTYLHEQAAQLAALDIQKLLGAVRHTEKKLERWAEKQRREEFFQGHAPVDDGQRD